MWMKHFQQNSKKLRHGHQIKAWAQLERRFKFLILDNLEEDSNYFG